MFESKTVCVTHCRSGVLYLKAGEGVNYMSTFMRSNMQKWMEAGNHKPVKFIEVENTPHHLHLTHPDIIANHVADFLK
jgi:pimeloyl-ACP methyl ester carboxylesterase